MCVPSFSNAKWRFSMPPLMTTLARRVVLPLLILLGVTLLVLGGGFLVIEYDGNIHTLVEGKAFRSAQLNEDELKHLVAQHGIRSILNLRGTSLGQPWYEKEVATADELGLVHIDYGISANLPVSLEKMHRILELLDKAPKPVLIHCKSGADRTGLVSALYLAANGQSESRARSELSVRYGHLPFFGVAGNTQAMDDSLDLFFRQRAVALTPK